VRTRKTASLQARFPLNLSPIDRLAGRCIRISHFQYFHEDLAVNNGDTCDQEHVLPFFTAKSRSSPNRTPCDFPQQFSMNDAEWHIPTYLVATQEKSGGLLSLIGNSDEFRRSLSWHLSCISAWVLIRLGEPNRMASVLGANLAGFSV
jgi:hypothetical protein